MKEETRKKFDLATVSSCKDTLELFYKLNCLMNKYDLENLSNLLDFEDDLYLAKEKCKKQTKITDFFKK